MPNLRSRCWFAALAMLVVPVSSALAQSGGLISRSEATRHGLERGWFTQVQIHRGRGEIQDIVHAGDTLFVLTGQGLVHSIDAESGRTHWSVQVGSPQHPSLAPAANDAYVAVINGSQLYVIDRATGRAVWDRRLGDAPGAGPAITEARVFVPMINGRIESYELENSSQPPWAYYSDGRVLIPPIATDESICWSTDKGLLYAARAVNPEIRFRVETKDEITSSPAYGKPYIYAASLDGYVYAFHETTGDQHWRFAAGSPIDEQPVVLGDRVYVCPMRAGMFCLNSEDASVIWWTPEAAKFVAASEGYVYANDKKGHLLVLDAQSGAQLGALAIGPQARTFVNTKTDRIYLLHGDGLIQCLYDQTQTEPLVHQAAVEEEAQQAEAIEQRGLEEAIEPEPEAPADDAGGDNPFGGGADAADDDPAPADDAGGDNPFGGDNNPFN